jgi:hypothetical protein
MLVGIIVIATNHSSDHIGIGHCDFYFIWSLLANAKLFAYTILMTMYHLYILISHSVNYAITCYL